MSISVKILIFLILIFILSLVNNAFSYPLLMISKDTPHTITDLIERSKLYDGKIVEIKGEVIGDILDRGKYAWININDGSSSIGIWGAKELFSKINFTGDYNTKGDYIKVTGIFRRADPKQGGELDIEALSLKVISVGRKVEHPVSYHLILITLTSSSIAVIIGLIWLKIDFNRRMAH
jgi:hypothetical protein